MSKSQFVGIIPFNDNLMLSKKVYRHVPTYIHVHSSYVECVVLLLRAD